jgi:phosphopantetheinyl transferase
VTTSSLIWTLTGTTRLGADRGWEACLTAEERSLPDRVNASGRPTRRLRRALLRCALATLSETSPLSLRFEHRCLLCGDLWHGKPRLTSGGARITDFSASSTSDTVVVAATFEGTIGVDVESRERDLTDAASLFCSEAEIEALRRNSGLNETDLLRIWTQKEALAKATGHGLAFDPRMVPCTKTLGRSTVMFQSRSWVVETSRSADLCVSAATESGNHTFFATDAVDLVAASRPSVQASCK